MQKEGENSSSMLGQTRGQVTIFIIIAIKIWHGNYLDIKAIKKKKYLVKIWSLWT